MEALRKKKEILALFPRRIFSENELKKNLYFMN